MAVWLQVKVLWRRLGLRPIGYDTILRLQLLYAALALYKCYMSLPLKVGL